MGVIEQRQRMIAAQPHLVTATGESLAVNITEPKINRLAVSFLPVQTGSGTPSPSNVRPISGFSEIPVYLTASKNLFDKSAVTRGYYIKSNGQLAGDNTWCLSPYIPVSGQASISYLGLTTVGNAPYSAWYDASKNFISSFKQAVGTNTINIPSGAAYARFSVFVGASGPNLDSFMVVGGSQIGNYEPYRGISPSISLGGTYYGGTVDLVSGVMTVTMGFNSFRWGYGYVAETQMSNYTMRAFPLSAKSSNTASPGKSCCNMAPWTSAVWARDENHYYFSVSGNIAIGLPNGTNDETVITAAYELETPQTVQLTPQTIAALRGQQTVTSPAGSVEIGYWAQDDTVRQMSYGGIPVYRDNVAYANSGGMVDDFVQDSNYFIALCDTGTTASKDVTFLRIADTLTSGNNFSVRGFSDLSSRSIADWTAGGYETARTLTATARYFACPIKKSRAADMYMTVTIGGVTTYIYKGNNV